MEREKGSFLENLVMIMIVLVIIQTLLEDMCTLWMADWASRRILVFTGVVFDLFFTIEFLLRFQSAVVRKKTFQYMVKQRGWVDFLASVPLLVFHSGPSAFSIMSAGGPVFAAAGVLNVLKIIKAVRIARVLRLLRVLKIFRQLKYADSPMAQRHIAKIATAMVSAVVAVVLISQFAGSFSTVTGDSSMGPYHDGVAGLLAEDSSKLKAEDVAKKFPDILVVKLNGNTLYTRYDNDYYRTQFGPLDYSYETREDYEVFFDLRWTNALQARTDLVYLLIIIGVIIVLVVYYSPHFALTVTDPLHVMHRGMTEQHYNLEVKILPKYADDDVFRLAKAYNEGFLPMKGRMAEAAPLENDIKIEKIEDLFKGL